MPVCRAASGMPKNCEVCSSCTITVPPIFLIAFTPIAPSRPVPESTTAMARSLYAAAVDSNSRSADGRTKCTSSDCDSDTVRSGFTSRWRFGGAIKAQPGSSASPSRASLTSERGALAEDLGHQAAVARVEVLHHDQRHRKISRQDGQHVRQRAQTAGRGGEGDDLEAAHRPMLLAPESNDPIGVRRMARRAVTSLPDSLRAGDAAGRPLQEKSRILAR